jgi:hypothetical protein
MSTPPRSPTDINFGLDSEGIKDLICGLFDGKGEEEYIGVFCLYRGGEIPSHILQGENKTFFFKKVDDLILFLPTLKTLNEEGFDIYYSINPLKEKSIKKSSVFQVLNFLVDLDYRKGFSSTDLPRILNSLESLSCPPSFVVGTGHGYHFLYHLRFPSPIGKETDIALSRLITAFEGADPTHIASLSRIPGFLNRKEKQANLISIVYKSKVSFILENFLIFEEKKSEIKKILRGECKEARYSSIEEAIKTLKGEDKGEYYVLTCPACNKKEAYLYKNSNQIRCNRLHKCGAVFYVGSDETKDIFQSGKTGQTILKPSLSDARFLIKKKGIRCVYDEFSDQYLIEDHGKFRPIEDTDLTILSEWMEQWSSKKRWNLDLLKQTFMNLCFETKIHPVKELIEKTSWDGVERISCLFEDIFCVEKSPYHINVAYSLFSQLIRRIYEPGCKAEGTLILIGPQGIGKSTFCKVLALNPSWYLDSLRDLYDKDSLLCLKGKLVVEFSDLAAWNRTDLERIKSFISTSSDVYRIPYDKFPKSSPRTCVFIATTNKQHPLIDPTGNRRFWPVFLNEKINIDLFKQNILLYYAEALHRYKQGHVDFIEAPSEILEEAFDVDDWEHQIRDFIEGKEEEGVMISDIATLVLKIEPGFLSRSLQTRIGMILQRLGWYAKRVGTRDKRIRKYFKANSE